jgi:hypothetical protein
MLEASGIGWTGATNYSIIKREEDPFQFNRKKVEQSYYFPTCIFTFTFFIYLEPQSPQPLRAAIWTPLSSLCLYKSSAALHKHLLTQLLCSCYLNGHRVRLPLPGLCGLLA